ncbi:hypothetical protein [Burkholderia sp. BCC1993]|uniref:hypothetical protein n=1 Tax=Burkholderia sp. BCC1993 TaxID=2817444 RepID=UPI002AB2C80D|nr:hypothetical protein [Burkholderia sp. BCC1993]
MMQMLRHFKHPLIQIIRSQRANFLNRRQPRAAAAGRHSRCTLSGAAHHGFRRRQQAKQRFTDEPLWCGKSAAIPDSFLQRIICCGDLNELRRCCGKNFCSCMRCACSHLHRSSVCAAHIAFDAELLYAAALFHGIGLTEGQRHRRRRDEIDGRERRARVSRFSFPGGYGVAAEDAAAVRRAIALHAAVGIHPYMTLLTALRGAGVEADLFTLRCDEVGRAKTRQNATRSCRRGNGARASRRRSSRHMPRAPAHRPETAFANVCADVPERCDPGYRRTNFRGLVLGSKWAE